MSITIIDTPKIVDFCKNPLAFKVLGSNYVIVGEEYSSFSLTKVGTSLIDFDIKFEFNDTSVTLSFVASPDDSGNQIQRGGSLSQILAGFQANYILNKFYTITLSSATFNFVSKYPGSKGNCTLTIGSPTFTNFPYPFVFDPEYAENYKILSKILIEETYDSGIYTELFEMLSDVDSNGNAVIYINNKLKDSFTNIDLPTFNQSTITRCEYAIKKYLLNFWEYYGETPVVKKKYASNQLYAIKGNIPFNIFPGYDFVTDVAGTKKPLSNKPDVIETWDTAQQYLYFFNWMIMPMGTNILNERIKIFYTDGTNSTHSLSPGYLNPKQYEIFIIPTGASQLNLNAYVPTKIIDYYEINLYLNDAWILRTQTYKLVNKPVNYRTFLYENNFGVLETLLAGAQKREVTVEKINTQRDLPYNYNTLNGELNSDVINEYDIYTVTTGNKSKTEMEHLREMLTNKYLFLIGGNDFFRCFIIPNTFKLIDENNDLYALQFQYRLANNKDITLNGAYNSSYNESYDIN